MMNDLDFLRKYPDRCCTEVSRKGESQPCDEIAVAVIVGDDPDGSHWWPVCVYHTRKGRMVSLADLVKALAS